MIDALIVLLGVGMAAGLGWLLGTAEDRLRGK